MKQGCGEAPGAASSGDVAVFSSWLRASGKDFLVLEEDGTKARVRFVGRFQDKDVVWDCRFVTLREVWQSVDTGSGTTQPLRSFIDIGAPDPTGVPIHVGLDIERIDNPAILKMIVMIRNYKRLKPGRHEFGAPFRAA